MSHPSRSTRTPKRRSAPEEVREMQTKDSNQPSGAPVPGVVPARGRSRG